MEKVTVMENKMYEDRNEDAIEIDVLELLFALRKKLWMIILAAVIGCLGAGIYSKVILSPVYTSTSMVYVLSKEDVYKRQLWDCLLTGCQRLKIGINRQPHA